MTRRGLSAGSLLGLLWGLSGCWVFEEPQHVEAGEVRKDIPCEGGRSYLDEDGDGLGVDSLWIDCNVWQLHAHIQPPRGWQDLSFAPLPGDCDDRDPLLGYWVFEDQDLDGYRADGSESPRCGSITDRPYGYVAHLDAPADCDDSDPEVATTYYRDADGDGHASNDLSEVCGSPDRSPPGTVRLLAGLLDCDDHDPEAYYEYYRDSDGDGYLDEGEAPICAGNEPPAGTVPFALFVDCASHDPQRALWVYPDADQDTVADAAEPLDCVNPAALPAGTTLANDPIDCDPQDASRSAWIYPNEGDASEPICGVLAPNGVDPR